MEVRQATREDFERFFGVPPAVSFYGVVVEHEGEPLGFGGVAHTGLGSLAFMDSKIEPAKNKRAVVLAARKMLDMMERRGRYILAAPGDDVVAPKFLARLGFEPSSVKGWYQWQPSSRR